MHGLETFSALLALCEGNQYIMGGFTSQRASNVDLRCFLCHELEQAIKQIMDLLVIWETVTLMWCYNNDLLLVSVSMEQYDMVNWMLLLMYHICFRLDYTSVEVTANVSAPTTSLVYMLRLNSVVSHLIQNCWLYCHLLRFHSQHLLCNVWWYHCSKSSLTVFSCSPSTRVA